LPTWVRSGPDQPGRVGTDRVPGKRQRSRHLGLDSSCRAACRRSSFVGVLPAADTLDACLVRLLARSAGSVAKRLSYLLEGGGRTENSFALQLGRYSCVCPALACHVRTACNPW
jgi:hypothetical protein